MSAPYSATSFSTLTVPFPTRDLELAQTGFDEVGEQHRTTPRHLSLSRQSPG
jgi:hypothetical protein